MPPSKRYRGLPTEQRNPASRHIDTQPVKAVLRLLHKEDARVPAAVAREAPRIELAVELIARSWKAGGRLFFVGAGTSGRLGVLEAAECPPTFGVPASRVRALMAGGKGAVFKTREHAEDDAAEGARRMRAMVRPGDVVVGVAASGVTPFVHGALRAAKAARCGTVLVTSNPRARVPGALVIAPDVGPEFITGSTRLKSATAAKLVLNALTTVTMIRLGKVHDNVMVDLRPTSYKLRQRGLRILGELGRLPPRKAEAVFEAAGGNVKTAVVMARLGVDAPEARRRLRAAGGVLRKALERQP